MVLVFKFVLCLIIICNMLNYGIQSEFFVLLTSISYEIVNSCRLKVKLSDLFGLEYKYNPCSHVLWSGFFFRISCFKSCQSLICSWHSFFFMLLYLSQHSLLINIFSFIIGSEILSFEGGKLTQILHKNKTLFGKAKY